MTMHATTLIIVTLVELNCSQLYLSCFGFRVTLTGMQVGRYSIIIILQVRELRKTRQFLLLPIQTDACMHVYNLIATELMIGIHVSDPSHFQWMQLYTTQFINPVPDQFWVGLLPPYKLACRRSVSKCSLTAEYENYCFLAQYYF